jgi:hypothetical protein
MFGSTHLLCNGAAVLTEHDALKVTAARMRGLCTALSHGNKPSLVEINRLLSRFSADLSANFATEEQDGYFESLVAVRPECDALVAHLHAEHVLLTEAVEALRNRARTERRNPLLGSLLSRTLDQFQTHERSENRLLQEFFLLDEGGEGE